LLDLKIVEVGGSDVEPCGVAFAIIDPMPYRKRGPRPMKPRLLDSSPRNPSRVPSWRWDHAGHALETGTPIPSRSDAWTRRAYLYRKRYEACATTHDLIVLEAQDPAISEARALRRVEANDPWRVTVHAIEARLLAIQPHTAIAARTAIDAETIEAYEQLFFDVAGRHDQVDYIATQVMGPAFDRGSRFRPYPLLWRLYGWGFGPEMVDALWTTLPTRSRPEDVAAMLAALEDADKANTRLKELVAAATVNQAGDRNAMIMIQEFVNFCEGDKAAVRATRLNGLLAVMEALPFRVGTAEVPPAVAGRRLANVQPCHDDSGAAEVRGDERMRRGAGLDVPALARRNRLEFSPPDDANAS
jgi:hypothetical protein